MLPHKIHSVIPIPTPHERQAMGSKFHGSIDGPQRMFVDGANVVWLESLYFSTIPFAIILDSATPVTNVRRMAFMLTKTS